MSREDAGRALQRTRGYTALEYLAGLLGMLTAATRAIARPPFSWRTDFVAQCSMMMRRCLFPLAVTSFAAGVGTEGYDGGGIARNLGVLDRFGTGYEVAGLREFSPFLTGLVVAGVVGTAVCADLGARKVRDELDATAVLGVDPVTLLVAPRFLAFVVMTPALAFFGVVANTLGGVVTFAGVYHVPPETFLASFAIQLTVVDVLVSTALKCMFYGVIIATVFCFEGFNASGGAEGVGRAVNRGVVFVFVAIFIFNFAFNAIVFAAFPDLQGFK